MARYTGPKNRVSRRLGADVFDTRRSGLEKRPYPPGQHGRGRIRETEYLLQMREKQKCARIYGVLEKQFRGYYEEANKKSGKTGENLLVILESRLDNVVYRAGFTTSRDHARQAVRHGHVLVNGKKVDIPSYRVSANDIVEIRPKSRDLTPYVIARETAGDRGTPPWMEVISSQMRVLVHNLPTRQVIDTPVQEQLIVELYSK